MPRFCLTIAYDGRPYAGWQSQPDAETVQDTIEAAIASLAGVPAGSFRVHGSGRTDAGVHALGQVAHFDAPKNTSMEPSAWARAINAKLPASIRIMNCHPVHQDFHARFSAKKKSYVYRIYHSAVHPPLEAGRSWHIHGALDLDAIRIGLEAIEGRHDFRAFAANRGDESDTAGTQTRTVFGTQLTKETELVALEFTGEGFLYKMVRLLTGGLARCGQGRESIDWFLNLLEDPKDQKCQYCAPAHGLYLMKVDYD